MEKMTGIERMTNQLKREPVDRISAYEAFWSDTHRTWTAQGHIREDENLDRHFDYDLTTCSAFDLVADMDFVPEIVEETEETRLVRDGNGALLRRHKLHDTTPEHVDFMVKDRTLWEERIKPLLVPDEKRIDFEGYRRAKAAAREDDRFFMWCGVNVFECMHPVCGHEHMLVGMAMDPDWVRDMVETYANLLIGLQEILFAKEGYPDGIWYWEDMGFKERPFFSPNMYKEIIQPAHARTIGFAHAHKLPVIMHSCGYVEPLLPGMIEAGIDCLQVIEVKAGMDLIKLYKQYGDRISLMGGMDVRKLYTNDLSMVEEELVSKIPTVMEKFGYMLHSDHSIPNTVDYQTYCYFLNRGRELGTYK